MSCRASFELRKMEKPTNPVYIVIGLLVWALVLICGYCSKFWKCSDLRCYESSDENVSEAAVSHQEYDYEPAGAEETSQPWMPSYPVPAYTHSDPLVHNPPTVDAANAEVPAPADDATVLSLSDNEPQFELKGMHLPLSLPLNSDSVYQDVYTSDKLSFK